MTLSADSVNLVDVVVKSTFAKVDVIREANALRSTNDNNPMIEVVDGINERTFVENRTIQCKCILIFNWISICFAQRRRMRAMKSNWLRRHFYEMHANEQWSAGSSTVSVHFKSAAIVFDNSTNARNGCVMWTADWKQSNLGAPMNFQLTISIARHAHTVCLFKR